MTTYGNGDKISTGETRYEYVGSSLAYQVTTNVNGAVEQELYFFYDASGNLSVIRQVTPTKDYHFYVTTNAQGDVLGIYSSTGILLASYEYDAWGNCTISYDNPTYKIGETNPIRYRGYYYNSETRLYYLQSRYYDPEIGRFLNADDRISNVGDVHLNYNVFFYCGNNPVCYKDPHGTTYYSNAKDEYDTADCISIFEILFVSSSVAVFTTTPQGAVLIEQLAELFEFPEISFSKKSKTSGKERATDIPSWVNKGQIDYGASAEENAWRMLNEKFGKGNWNKGPNSDFNKIKKWLTRHCGLKSFASSDSDIEIVDGHLIIYDNSGEGFGWFDGMYMKFFD